MSDVEMAMATARVRWADHIREVSAPLTTWMLDRLEPLEGRSVLDIAAGVGDPGFEVARRLGPRGRLTMVDISRPAIEAARRRARDERLENVTFHVVDAQRMDLEPASFDRVFSRWGYMLMPDTGTALGRTRRALRPDGRLVFAVWGPETENPWAGRMRRALGTIGLAEAVDLSAPGGMFSLADELSLRAVLEAARWEVLDIEGIRLTWRYPDFESYWDYACGMAGELAPILDGLVPAELARVRDIVAEGARPFTDGEGYAFPGLSIGVLATRQP